MSIFGAKNLLFSLKCQFLAKQKKSKCFSKLYIFFPKGPYKQFRASGIEFDFADPSVSYVAKETGKEVRLSIDASQPVPKPELVRGEKNELQIAVRLFLELVVRPATNSSSADAVLSNAISYMESLKSTSISSRTSIPSWTSSPKRTSIPNHTSIPFGTEDRKRSQSEVKSCKKSKKN